MPATGLFIYGYSCYYYFARSDMSGFMQTSCETAHHPLLCVPVFLLHAADVTGSPYDVFMAILLFTYASLRRAQSSSGTWVWSAGRSS